MIAAKKKLLVILGAGSSVERGLPSVGALDDCFKQWGREWASQYGFPDYFDRLWRSTEEYYRSGHSRHSPPLKFEKVLGDLVALAHWMEPAPWGGTLRQITCNGAPPPDLVFPSPYGDGPYGPSVLLHDQLRALLIKLTKHVRALSQKLEAESGSARQYRTLYEGLRQVFDVGVYNLNYDTVALAAWPHAYTGFTESGAFDPIGLHHRPEWGFIYHLHGSVHHSLVREFGEEICWRPDLRDNGSFFDGHAGLSGDKRSEGREFPRTTLIAGGFKLDQLLVEPFHSMHATLVRHVYAADAILLGGYGFGDEHVNRALRNRLAAAAVRPPVMVIDCAGPTTDPMEIRDDSWAHQLCSSLGAASSLFREPGHSSYTLPSELAAKDRLEVNAAHRVAIWYGGFTAITRRLDNVLSWLGGGQDDVLTSARLSRQPDRKTGSD